MITYRPYHSNDALALLALFRDTIRRVNIRDYTPEQIGAWSSDEIDPVIWANRFIGRFTVVAEVENQPIGFAELEPNGHIDRVYVSADHQGQGIAKQLLSAIFNEAKRLKISRLIVEASITARPFFESQGFTTITSQIVNCRGVDLMNYRMERIFSESEL